MAAHGAGGAFVSGADESMLVARPPVQRVQCLARAGRSPRGRGRGRRTAPQPRRRDPGALPPPPPHPAPLPQPPATAHAASRHADSSPSTGRGSRWQVEKKINASAFALVPLDRAGVKFWSQLVHRWGRVFDLFCVQRGLFFRRELLQEVLRKARDGFSRKVVHGRGRVLDFFVFNGRFSFAVIGSLK